MSSTPRETVSAAEPVSVNEEARLADARDARVRRVVIGMLGLTIAAGLFLVRDAWIPSSWLFGKRDEAPAGLSWLPFGTTRQQILERLAKAGNGWETVIQPGMAPNAWVAHNALRLDGLEIPQLSLLYSDSRKYNYGVINGRPSEETIDPVQLLGDNPPDGKVVGIRWKVARRFWQTAADVVPSAVLGELGQPHRQEKDIVGTAQNFFWDWPTVEAKYFGSDGLLEVVQKDESSKIDQHGGPGNLPAMGGAPPVGGAAPEDAAAVEGEGRPADEAAPDR